jgi:hypothetical protein
MMVMSMDMKRTAASEQRLHTPSVTVLSCVFERGGAILGFCFWMIHRTKSKLGLLRLYAALKRKGSTNEIVTKWHSLAL